MKIEMNRFVNVVSY